MATIEFSKEQAREALKDLRRGKLVKVKLFLEAVERYFPSREEYKNRKVEDTSKQKARRLKLKKEKTDEANTGTSRKGRDSVRRAAKLR